MAESSRRKSAVANKEASPRPDRVRFHMIGHAHLDPVWLWRWYEGFAEAKATFRSALDRMKEFPDFVFTASAAAHYEWIEKSDPAMFAEIKRRVKEGRWVPAGGWWVESDLNMVNGECLVRQALLGKRYFREKFGFECRVGFSPDSFGHSAHLPKILRGCGFEGYLYMRPNDTENPRVPMPVYRWSSPDGSEVIAFRIVWGYNAHSVQALETKHEKLPAIIKDSPFNDLMFFFYGVGNHGGGPTIELLKTIKQWQKDPARHELVFSSMERFLDEARPRLEQMPRWSEELQIHALGCETVVAQVKATNRRAEETLLTAEHWASAAQMAVKREPDRPRMKQAWKDLLFNQFHDILPGSSVAEAYVDQRDQVGGAIHAGMSELTESLTAITSRVNSEGPPEAGAPLFVFNHQPFPFEGVIETEDIGFGLTPEETLRLTDADGREVPQQLVPAHTMCQRVRLAARVAIPPLGYTMLRQHKVRKADLQPSAGSVTSRGASLRNEYLELTLNDEGLLLMRDLRTGEDVFTRRGENGGAGCVPALLMDRTDTWSHRVDRFHGSMGRFELHDAEVIEPGPIRGRLRVTYRYRASLLRLDFVLGSGEPFAVVDGWVDWRERWKILKLSMRTGLEATESTAEVPFGTASRVCDGREWPMSQWVDISAGGRGLAVANNCKHGYSAHGRYGPNLPGELRISLLRSPPHAYDDTVPADFEYPHYHFTDQGVHEFKLALIPHAGDWRAARVIEIARLLNRPPTCLAETFHRGPLPTTGGFLTCEGEGVYVTAIKPAEDGQGWIVRAAEWHGRATTARLALPTLKRRWSAKFGPWQLKTFFVPARAGAKVSEVNLIED